MKHLTLFLCAICCALSITAADFSVDGIRYNILDEYSVAVTSHDDGYSGDVIIPNKVTYDGVTYAVTTIGYRAFEDCSALTSVTLPNTLTTIEMGAFYRCTKLTSLHIPASVTTIKEAALYYCPALTSITVANGNAYYDSRDNCNAVIAKASNTLVFGCQKTIIPKTVTEIGYAAFANCSTLISITIPNNVTRIGAFAFYECWDLKDITIPASVTTIGKAAFEGTYWYNTLPDGVVYVNKVLYRYKGSMPENHFVVVKDGTVSISTAAFKDEDNLTHITIPNSVTAIGSEAFYNCDNLTSIVLPNKLKTIESSTFYGCDYLEYVTIPKSVKSIESSAFSSCGLDQTIYLGDIASWCAIKFDGISSNPIYASNNLFIKGELLTDLVIPSSVDSINAYAFAGNYALNSVTIPTNLKRIGAYAFSDCSNLLQTIYKGDIASWCSMYFANESANPVSYSNNLYLGEHNLVDLSIPQSVTQISDYAFVGCKSLSSVHLPASIKRIGVAAFQDCINLSSTHFGGDIASWCGIQFASVAANPISCSENLFLGGLELHDLVIPDQVQKVGDYAFVNCKSLHSVQVPSSVVEIGNSAFHGCALLTSLTWNAQTYAAYSGFDCIASQITSLTIGPAVQYLPSYLCKNMTSLSQVTLPASVTRIGESAFASCSALQRTHYTGDIASWCGIQFDNSSANPIHLSHNLYINGEELRELIIPDSITQLHPYAFYGCNSLISVTIPASVKSIGALAFDHCEQINMTNYTGDIASWCAIDFASASANPMVYSNNFYINHQEVRELVVDSVSQISNYAFAGCHTITSLTIVDSVKTIGERAFAECYNLASISIPNSVTSIAANALDYCSALTSINWNAGEYIGEYPFDDLRSQIQSITFGEAVNNVPGYFCYKMTALKSLSLSSSITAIGEHAFDYCSALSSVTLGTSVLSIGAYAFDHCRKLESITLNRRLQHIGADAFKSTNALAKVTYLGNYATWCNLHLDNEYANPLMQDVAFYVNGYQVKDVVIPTAIDTIRNYVFAGLSSLSSVQIPSTVTHIGNAAFYGCKSIKHIEIPASVTSIGSHAFNQCLALSSITWNANAYVGKLPFEDVRSQITSMVIGDSVTEIPASLCAKMSKLSHLTIPTSVTSIGNSAFLECSTLKSVALPAGLRTIGDKAFDKCKALSSITLPDGLESIGTRAFTECSALTHLQIPSTVHTIGDAAFRKCSALQNIVLSPALSRIGEYTFFDCGALTSIRLPETIQEIDDYAFYNCSALDSLMLPAQTKIIGKSAFEGCSNLKYVYVGQQMSSIAANAFEGCTMLYTVLWDAKFYAGTYPFVDIKSKIKSFIFGENVQHISSLFCDDMSNQTAIMWRATNYDGTIPLQKVLKQVLKL